MINRLKFGGKFRIWLTAIFFLNFLLIPILVPAQELGYYRSNYFKSLVTANKSGRLVSENEVFVKAVRHNAGFDIFFNKLQDLNDFHVYFKYFNSDNYLEIKPIAEVTGAESDMHYSGMVRVIVYLPDTGDYKITYRLEADDPMLAGTLNPVDEGFDSISYIYRIPEKFKLLYKIDGDSSRIRHLKDKKTEEFTIFPKNKVHDYTLFPGQDLFQMPVVSNLRVLIVPAEYATRPEAYFSEWYFRSLGDNHQLNAHSKHFADSLCAGLTDTLEIIRALYGYVNQKINYIGLFDKWNAFIPQPVDEVLEKRFGDCKNMANLLTSLLRYKGMRAFYGITASVFHPVDMDFPCLASGDHAICVVRAGGEWHFLDPTNKLMLEMRPPGYLQGRTVFIADPQNPFYLEVPLLPPDLNLARIDVDLFCDDAGISGSFHSINTHYFRQELLNTYYAYGNPLFSEMLPLAVLGSHFHFTYDSVYYSINDTSMETGGKIRLPADALVQLQNGNLALFPVFITVPGALMLSNRKFDLITVEPQRTELSYLFNFTREVDLVEKEPVIYRRDGVTFEFGVKQTGPREILVNATFELHYPVYRLEDLDYVNECSALIYQTMRDAIVLE